MPGTRKTPNRYDLLVFLAVAAILAAVILPTIHGAQIRAKTGRVLFNFGQLSGALERYRMEHGAIPFGRTDLVRYDLRPLTTPIAYIKSVKGKDVFRPRKIRRDGSLGGNDIESYLYFHLNGSWADRNRLEARHRTNTYLLESHGPDRIQDFVPQFAAGIRDMGPEQVYDPTNGLLSSGDIAVWGWESPYNPIAASILRPAGER